MEKFLFLEENSTIKKIIQKKTSVKPPDDDYEGWLGI